MSAWLLETEVQAKTSATIAPLTRRTRPARLPRLFPQALPASPGIDRPAGNEAVEDLRVRRIRASLAEGMHLAEPLLGFLHDVAQVEYARLELGRRGDPLDQGGALPRGGFGRRGGKD